MGFRKILPAGIALFAMNCASLTPPITSQALSAATHTTEWYNVRDSKVEELDDLVLALAYKDHGFLLCADGKYLFKTVNMYISEEMYAKYLSRIDNDADHRITRIEMIQAYESICTQDTN